MKIDLIVHTGEILLVFDEPYKWVAFRPEDAKDFAKKLTAVADEALLAKPTGTVQ